MLTRHLVTRYNTLRDLALEYLGSADRWTEIAAANGLKSADLTAKIGSEIIIPLEVPGRQDPYLVDMLILDGDLAETENGDIRTVGGKDNYALSIIRLFATERGELRQHRLRGLDVRSYAGEAMSGLASLLIRLEVQEILLSDARTAKVVTNEVDYLSSQKRLAIRAIVEDIGGGQTNFEYERSLTDG